ncbi:beta galactosidase jelly roll domain-containing protein [Sunxiuqinia sp. sy24]|uniref:beta galactosidase jelly roll domain-containing protein n=1 Tax=Sunxiuqinia sp. sy24 TaxID=3461495 RepID=UPI004045E351
MNAIRWFGSLVLIFVLAHVCVAFEPDEKDLRGLWKFRIGDQREWASVGYDDSAWDQIRVPARWENEGFRGYDGYAWYRTQVVLDETIADKKLVLELGYIDDVDEVFINGVKIGQTGSFPPRFSTAYNASRKYQVPSNLIRIGEQNLIAVRVYDSQLEGGIVSGNLRIYSTGVLPPFLVDLTGSWLFNKGKAYNQRDQREIQVPGAWENQGYNNYDGYAVYTRKIELPATATSQRLVLLAGKIDDADQLYLNGLKIGQTGDLERWSNRDFYGEFRNYFFPPDAFKAGEENILEIRVYDRAGLGGIYEGPVGIMTQDQFRKYWKSKRRN